MALTLQDGRACIVNQSAVRWLSGVRDLWNLMHTDSLDNVRMVAEAVAVEREACAKVCDELEERLSASRYTALLNGDASPSNMVFSEPLAARHMAAAIRARGSHA